MSEPIIQTGSLPNLVLSRDPSATALVGEMRKSELDTISTRLGRVCNRRMHWDQFFGVLSTLFFGGVIGGCLGLIPFYSQEPSPRGYMQALYGLALTAALIVALLSLCAWVGIKKERADSVSDIKADLDSVLQTYRDHADGASQ